MEYPKNEITIRIAQLAEGLHEYHFLPEASEIGLEDNFQQPVRIDATLEKDAQQLYLKTSVHAGGIFCCDRCTDEFKRELTNEYAMIYVYNELDAAKFEEDEVHVIDIHAPSIDLTEDVRDVVTLAIPLKMLCKENCKGLCPQCGVNRNHQTCSHNDEAVDSRWDGLKKLINN